MTKRSLTKKQISLESFFRRQASRWALIGFLITGTFAIPCVLYSAKISSEKQLLISAKSLARAFRPMILQDSVRDAQFQMRKALELKEGESAIVRTPELKSVYPIRDSDNDPRCLKEGVYCWKSGFRAVSLLYPIYFDPQKNEGLFGYLELTLRPSVDLNVVVILTGLLIFAFACQAFGLTSALSQSSKIILNALSSWATHLRENPEKRIKESVHVPFADLKPMQEAVDSLHMEITKLREETAQEAKAEAQFSLLREISHDLKTPHALLARYFALHLDTLETSGKPDPEEVLNIHRTLKRMGDLLRQIKIFPGLQSSTKRNGKVSEACFLSDECKTAVLDLSNSPEILEKKIQIELNVFDAPKAAISANSFYRIFENLVRNAAEASPESGVVIVFVKTVRGWPTLVIQDNGSGIEREVQSKIFDFDFTTKASRGTGLGLGIVDRICKEVGATLRMDSIVGLGTTFTIRFQPADSEARQSFSKEVFYG